MIEQKEFNVLDYEDDDEEELQSPVVSEQQEFDVLDYEDDETKEEEVVPTTTTPKEATPLAELYGKADDIEYARETYDTEKPKHMKTLQRTHVS